MGQATLPAVLLVGLLAATAGRAQTESIGNARKAEGSSVAPAAKAKGPGLRISGRMDDATVQGLVCGDLARPFAAVSPEVEGTWSFVPKSATAGSFTYKARNVGGIPGSGLGTYVITRDANGGGRIKLDGTGSVHSPVGTFSATIYETLTLTPATGC